MIHPIAAAKCHSVSMLPRVDLAMARPWRDPGDLLIFRVVAGTLPSPFRRPDPI
jgi:hypothetical protein